MKRKLSKAIVLTIVVAGAGLTQAVPAPPQVSITDLGTLHGDSSVRAINARGQVVGFSSSHAFLWQDGVMTDLGTLPGGVFSDAYGINARGQVVGRSSNASNEPHAVLWQDGTITDLGTGGSRSLASAINNSGQVVGASEGMAADSFHAVLWQDGTISDLGTIPGKTNSVAVAINDKGLIAGDSYTELADAHAFLWQDGVMTDLGTLPGNNYSIAHDINTRGQVVGESGTCTASGCQGDFHAFLWQDGVMTDLGPGGALAINTRGQIAGISITYGNQYHAVLWEVRGHGE